MSEDIRKNWADYFKCNNMKYVFFSALEELNKFENNENDNSDNQEKSDKDDYKICNRLDLIKFIKNEIEQIKNNQIKNNNN
jgi:hypothetical protein